MSTKTLYSGPNGPDGDGDNRLVIFFALSVAIHILLAISLGFSGAASGLLKTLFREEEPIMVDVVELPPVESQALSSAKKTPTHYSDRTQSVEQETYPETSRRPAGRPARALSKGGVAKSAPAAKEGPKTLPPSKKEAAGDAENVQGDAVKQGPTEEANPALKGPRGQERTVQEPAARERASEGKRPNLFLSDERIDELTKRYEAETPKGEKGKTLQLNTSELRYQKYLVAMKDRIQFFWEYPDIASRSGWQGKLRIDFVINRDGTVGEIKLVKSSNYPVLDDAAITALRLATPFPPFPDSFGIESIVIRGNFEYQIEGRR